MNDSGGSRLSRRTFIGLGVGVAAVAVSPLGLAACSSDGVARQAAGAGSLPTLETITAQNGVLSTTLTCQRSVVEVGGQSMTLATYGGQVPGPLLRLSPGDSLQIKLDNQLPGSSSQQQSTAGNSEHSVHKLQAGQTDLTNMHTHGLHVSPAGNSDNVFLEAGSGQSIDYKIDIPSNHWGGLNWYHPHRHGTVFSQVASGMAGPLIISGEIDQVPEVADATEQILVLQNIRPTAAALKAQRAPDHSAKKLSMVAASNPFVTNGVVNPTLEMNPGEVQRWRILNADAVNEYVLQLRDANGQTVKGGLNVLAFDGLTLPRMLTMDKRNIVPGNRFDILVQAPKSEGTFTLVGAQAPNFRTGDITFLTVNVSGKPRSMSLPRERALPAALSPIKAEEVNRKREIVYGGPTVGGRSPMTINGLSFNDGNPDTQVVQLGDVEEWTIHNKSVPDNPHFFHIHTNPYMVVGINGEPDTAPAYWDVFSIPTGGSITVRMRFTDFAGKTVQHCHLLPHEDAGMMGIVEIV